jgi:hypothetical protein
MLRAPTPSIHSVAACVHLPFPRAVPAPGTLTGYYTSYRYKRGFSAWICGETYALKWQAASPRRPQHRRQVGGRTPIRDPFAQGEVSPPHVVPHAEFVADLAVDPDGPKTHRLVQPDACRVR